MNLPHLAPLLYAKEVLSKENEIASVLCDFDTVPTLSMFVEAAAQSSAAFSKDEDIKIGFLILVKNVKLIDKLDETKYIFNLTSEVELNNMKQFSFEAFSKENNKLVVAGEFTISIQI